MKKQKGLRVFIFFVFIAVLLFSSAAFSKTDIQPLLDEAKKLIEQSSFDEAIVKLNEAISQDKKSAKAYFLRGTAYTQKANYDSALEDLNSSIGLDANNADAYVARGNVYYNQTKDDLAFADYDKALSLDASNAEAYYKRGKLHEVRSEFDAAVEDYEKALSNNPKNLSLFDGLIYIYTTQKKYDKVVEAAEKAVEVFPEDSLFRKNIADAYMALGQLDNALVAYGKAMKLSSTYEADYYGVEGLIFKQKGQTDKALKSFSQAIDKGKSAGSSNLVTYYVSRGALYFDGKKYEEALMDYQDALLSNASNPDVYLGLGLTYFKMKFAKLTRKAMDKAFELEPGYKDIETHMKEKSVTYTKNQLETLKAVMKQFGY